MRSLPMIVALVVLAVGGIYAFARSPDYESTAQLVLTPDTTDPREASNLLDSFDRSGTMGTFVELYASDDTLRAASDPDVTVTVRAVPDSRVMRVTTRGDRIDVRGALSQVLAAGKLRENSLRDLWTTKVLQKPSAAERGRPGTGLVLLATLVLALLAGLFTAVLVRRTERSAGDRRAAGGR